MTADIRPDRSLWDEVWNDYDRRAAVHGAPHRPSAPTPRPSTPPKSPAAPRRPWRLLSHFIPRRLWGWRRSALALVALVCLYLGSPIASAVQFAVAVQRADPATLASRVDWSLLRPGIEARLTEIASTHISGPPPAFLEELKSSLADRLASPEGLARVLAHHLPPEGGTGFGQAMRQARPISPGLWQVSLASPHAPHQPVRLTLRLTDPLALQWAVVAVELPGRLGPWP
ncbi:DUF2939 domain-containing protein [Roseococcus suduntuyensis]|uniref:DUF2939 domain-containing protein n=1 Tax=Roseococcus suduntuyensis TaxID=455361 RepID=A0A840A6I6_9PROT|nr:DUF2939 domain-containing protein [Roseococcus suduntuyensis]MBB3897129.1 hypothetical protein [Roseococcus suduntuyensis]